ncbi:MAG: papain-like cysteine protease family protein [Rhodothermales bacterium]|nr:papain-like cysteine protease family protein [Rhodothermales bacterium]
MCSAGGPARAQEAVPVLDVPYVEQSEQLCGGAAAAMVLRYWGARGVYAEDFASLVKPVAGGIRTVDLTAALDSLGWQALPFEGTSAAVREHLGRGRPVIALIEVAPERYHYVVLTAWGEDRVLFHDPAAAPHRTLTPAAMDRAWAATGRWALLVLPRESPADAARPAPEPPATNCDALLREAADRASAGDVAGAGAMLITAESACPPATVLREQAALRFRQQAYGDAARLATEALALDPSDATARRVVASSRFLLGDAVAALRAWNALGEPRIDLVEVEGLARSRHAPVRRLLGLETGALLRPEAFERARRRLSMLPSAARAELRYVPLPDRSVRVEAAVVERPLLFGGWVDAAATVVQALPLRRATLRLTSPTGGGEQFTFTYRWQQNRPRAGVRLAAPAPAGLPGVAFAEGVWDRQTYALGEGAPSRRVETVRSATLGWVDWLASWLRGGLALGLDRYGALGSFGGADLRVRIAPPGAALRLELYGEGRAPLEGGRAFGGLGGEVRWGVGRSAARGTVRMGAAAVSREAPLARWPGAGTGSGRDALLRAHPLLDEGVVRGPAFGRVLTHGTVEAIRMMPSPPGLPLGLAVFVDAARVWHPLRTQAEPRVRVDAGAGVRIGLPGGQGMLRLDAATGLRDGATALSAGIAAPLQ